MEGSFRFQPVLDAHSGTPIPAMGKIPRRLSHNSMINKYLHLGMLFGTLIPNNREILLPKGLDP